MPEDHLLQFRIRPKKKVRRDFLVDFNPVYLSVGFYLMAPILVGVFIGYQLDKAFETKPFFVLLFIALGAISSFYNLWKLVKEK